MSNIGAYSAETLKQSTVSPTLKILVVVVVAVVTMEIKWIVDKSGPKVAQKYKRNKVVNYITLW